MIRKLISIVAILVASWSAPTLANNWEKFYTAVDPGSIPQEPSQSPPQIEQASGDFQADAFRMWERGYTLIGYTSFNSTVESVKDGIRLATKLKADVVLLNANLASTESVSIPITTPNTTTSTTYGNVSVSGNYGRQASGTYSGTTTQNSSVTTYAPITVNRFDKTAAYFTRLKRMGSGIMGRELSREERTQFETNSGLVVSAIRNNSPAYVAEILPGDIIVNIDGDPASDEKVAAWRKALVATEVESSKLVVLRKGARREILMTVSPEWRGGAN